MFLHTVLITSIFLGSLGSLVSAIDNYGLCWHLSKFLRTFDGIATRLSPASSSFRSKPVPIKPSFRTRGQPEPCHRYLLPRPFDIFERDTERFPRWGPWISRGAPANRMAASPPESKRITAHVSHRSHIARRGSLTPRHPSSSVYDPTILLVALRR